MPGILYLSEAVAHHRFSRPHGDFLCLYMVSLLLHAYVPYLENSLSMVENGWSPGLVIRWIYSRRVRDIQALGDKRD